MCGLVGMVGYLEHKHKAVMKDLLFLNTLRGRDSTGLTSIKRDRTVLTRKMTVPGYEFIEHPVVDKAMCTGDQAWIGHGRFKTTGEINRFNAHPFEVLDDNDDVMLVGTHNGTLTNKYEIERKLDGLKFDTDSEALFNYLTVAPNYKEAIGNLEGAWSLVWWDPTENAVHFCRNKERPMTFAFTKDRKALVYASEAWMIINACRRNGVELEQNDKGLSCYATNVDTLYTLDIPQERNVELEDLRKEGGYTGKPPQNFHNGQHWKNKFWWNDSKEKEEAKKEGKKETAANSEKKVVTLGAPSTGIIRGYGGETISLAQLDKLKEKGCGWCKEEISEGLVFAFLDEENLVCARCMRDTHPRENPKDYDEDLDDDLPFYMTDKGKDSRDQKDSKEYKSLIEASVTGAKAVG